MEWILAVVTAILGGIVLLIIEYRTRWFARHVQNPPRKPMTAPGSSNTSERESNDMTNIPSDGSGELMLKITTPKGFSVFGSNRFLEFPNWLSNPLRPGDNPGSYAYPIEGQVLPGRAGLVVEISIYTNDWWPQGKYFVRADGTFTGEVYLDQRFESATFRFNIMDTTGRVLRSFDATVL